MSKSLLTETAQALEDIEKQGLLKCERLITSAQSAHIRVQSQASGEELSVLNLCANNYLGLADDPGLIEAAKRAMDEYGLGMASVRFICGTQDRHRELESRLAKFLSTEDAILFASCFDANAGIFEALLDERDAIISDSLNHASIIDGVRLCKASRYRYANNNMPELESCLQRAQASRHRIIVTDGVFSMDGIIADIPRLVELAQEYDALLMVDDSHAVGFVGPNGAGTPDHYGLADKVDLLSGTFGKALGGAAGGYIAGPKPLVEMLRQRARPYLFSNALVPAVVAATIAALDLVEQGSEQRRALRHNADYFRGKMTAAGFDLVPGEHPIIPVMLGDAVLAQRFASAMLEQGVYVTAFAFPVVPKGQARIRTQMSAAHSREDLDKAVEAFEITAKSLGVI